MRSDPLPRHPVPQSERLAQLGLVIGSLVVWNGLRIASRDPDERYPFGCGRAEALAADAWHHRADAITSGAALTTLGVLAIEKLKIRKSGTAFSVDIHVQAEPALSLHDAHIPLGMVKTAIRQRVPAAMGVLIHMEPFEPTEDAS